MLGSQEPRICAVPDYVSSTGVEALELCAMAGLDLDPWQQFVLTNGLGERPDGKWAAFEVGVAVARQNGKGGIIEARELTGLFLLKERLQIHSAHQFDTSIEAFRRLLFLIEDTPDLDRRVKRVSRSHGEEGIELLGGQRIRFRTRTKGGGRGFTGDNLILDEAMFLPEMTVGALLPTLSARPNPQVWYFGSPVDRMIHEDGIVFARIRERGRRGGDPSLAYFEWSVDAHSPDALEPAVTADPASWAQANPALGIRISVEHVEKEYRSMDARTFAVERLGVGDWPATDGTEQTVIDPDAWDALTDSASVLLDPVCLAFDVSPDRSSACVSAAGLRPDGLGHIEVVEHGGGTGWVIDKLVSRIVELDKNHRPIGIVCDAAGPAASLLAQLEQAGIEVTTVSAKETAAACGLLYDAVDQQTVRHLGTSELASAVRGATRRPLGDAWAWSRKTSAADITPLVSCTLALWGSGSLREKPKAPPRVIDLSSV